MQGGLGLLRSPTPEANTFQTQAGLLFTAGLGLLVIAVAVLESVPLAALGGAALLLGIISLGFALASEDASDRLASYVYQAGWQNLARLVEESGTATAVYLPSLRTGRPGLALLLPAGAPFPREIAHYPNRVVLPATQGRPAALLVSTPGCAVPADGTVAGDHGAHDDAALFEARLRHLLVERLHSAADVEVLVRPNGATVAIRGAAVFPGVDADFAAQTLGLPLASVVASVYAEWRGRPVRMGAQCGGGSDLTVDLEDAE